MKKTREFYSYGEVESPDGVKRMILVYGELTEHDQVASIAIVTRNGKSGEVINIEHVDDVTPPTRTKELRMGWSITQLEHDPFDLTTGIRFAKKRFGEPMTTTNGCMLTEDMVYAILDNEVNFIANHLEKYTGVKQPQYIDMDVPIEIGCKKCGTRFWMTPQKHLEGYGCPNCYGDKTIHEIREEEQRKANRSGKREINIQG
jgi:hypothetical protein